jgi:hypothetical protein
MHAGEPLAVFGVERAQLRQPLPARRWPVPSLARCGLAVVVSQSPPRCAIGYLRGARPYAPATVGARTLRAKLATCGRSCYPAPDVMVKDHGPVPVTVTSV